MAETKKIGRPKGSGAGYVPLPVRVLPEVKAAIEAEGEARDVEPAVVAREVLTKWAERRKGAKR